MTTIANRKVRTDLNTIKKSLQLYSDKLKSIYAKKNGYYSSLVSGASENLLGRGNVEAEITRRTSGGSADIGSGSATIEKLMGKSLVWNQLVNHTQASVRGDNVNVSCTRESDGRYKLIVSGQVSQITSITFTSQRVNNIEGHKYLYSYGGDQNFQSNIAYGKIYWQNSSSTLISTNKKIYNAVVGSFVESLISIGTNTPEGTYYFLPIVFDLTLMFGAGYEPSTVKEFEALYPLSYYAQNNGTIINTTTTGLKTVGFNLFDERTLEDDKWINKDNGTIQNSEGRRASEVYFNCFPLTDYYITNTKKTSNYSIQVSWYDANKNYISSHYTPQTIITSPAAAAYFRIASDSSVGNLCINLSWSGYRNGEYEPYWTETLPIPITTLTGKKDGEGASVVVFPDGMKGVGTAFDEGIVENGYLTKVVKRFGSVDLGSLTWTKQATMNAHWRFYRNISDIKRVTGESVVGNIMCQKYATITTGETWRGTKVGISVNYASSSVDVFDETYSDAEAFKSAMNGVILNYELAEPEVYVLDEPIPMIYKVDDFGTEERMPEDTSSVVSTPLLCLIKYNMNAVDTLRRLGVNYIKKSSMDAVLTAFKTAGIIADYTLTYNAVNDDYDCTVTPPSTPSEQNQE